jgi:hypothetical protein
MPTPTPPLSATDQQLLLIAVKTMLAEFKSMSDQIESIEKSLKTLADRLFNAGGGGGA